MAKRCICADIHLLVRIEDISREPEAKCACMYMYIHIVYIRTSSILYNIMHNTLYTVTGKGWLYIMTIALSSNLA